MATYYVNPSASGSGNGSSMANAYTTIAAAFTGVTEASGDIFLVSNLLNETLSANLSSTVNNSGTNRGARFISVDPATENYSAGAKIVTAGFAVDMYGLTEGFTFDGSGTAANVAVRPGNGSEFVGCTFIKQGTFAFQFAGTTTGRGIYRGCTMNLGSSYSQFLTTNTSPGEIEILDCTLTGTKGTTASLVTPGTSGQSLRVRIVGTDCSGFDAMMDQVSGAATGYVDLRLEGCLRPATFEAELGAGDLLLRKGSVLTMIGTGNGTLSAPNIERVYWNHHGKGAIQSTVYRVGGGHDGTSRQAWALSAWANRTWTRSRHGIAVPVTGPWVYAGNTYTARVYLAHSGTTLTSDEVNFRIRTPSVAVSPTALGYTVSSAGALGSSAATHPTDSVSSWGGSPSSKQYIEHSFTPTISGPVVGEIMFHPGSSSDRTIYADAGIFIV